MTSLAILAHSSVLAAAAADGATDTVDALTPFLNYGVLGLLVILILTRQLVTKGELADIKAERDAWRVAYEKEHGASTVRDAALQVAQGQAGLALDNSKTLTAVFERLGHQPRDRSVR